MLPMPPANSPNDAIRPAYSSSTEPTPIGSYEKIARKIDALQLPAAQDPPPGTNNGMGRGALAGLVDIGLGGVRVGGSDGRRHHPPPPVPVNFAPPAPVNFHLDPQGPGQQVDQEQLRRLLDQLKKMDEGQRRVPFPPPVPLPPPDVEDNNRPNAPP